LILLVIGIQTVSACCGPSYEPSWNPPAAEGEPMEIQTDAVFTGTPKQMVAMLYAEHDGKRGADMCLRVYADRTWRLAAANPEMGGLHDVPVASGVVDGDGFVEGMPESFFHDAQGIWARDDMATFTINGEVVP